MKEHSGKARTGIHSYEDGEVFTLTNMIFNCHVCHKTFSPVRTTLKTTNKSSYYRGLWSRVCLILEVDEDKLCGCEEYNEIMMYDNPDPVFESMGKDRRKNARC
jgi:hypothetical protein